MVATRRQAVAVGAGAAGSAYEELDRKQRELTSALDEAAKLRAESDHAKTEVNRLRDDLAATARERDGLRATGLELNRLKDAEGRFQTELETTREELTRERQQRETLASRLAAQEAEAPKPGVADQELAALREQLAKLSAEHDGLQTLAAQREAELKNLAQLSAVPGDLQEVMRTAIRTPVPT